MATVKLSGLRNGRVATVGDTDSALIDGSLTIGDDINEDTIEVNAEFTSHLIPDVDDTYDLGSASKKWRVGYFDEINFKQREIYHARYNTDDTNIRFIRWVTSGVNNNTDASGSSCLIVPKNGTVDSIQIRTKKVSNSTDIKFHRVGNNVGIPISATNFTTIQTENVNIDDTNTVFTVNFTNATFSADDVIGISVTPTNSTGDVLMTIVLTYDWNS